MDAGASSTVNRDEANAFVAQFDGTLQWGMDAKRASNVLGCLQSAVHGACTLSTTWSHELG